LPLRDRKVFRTLPGITPGDAMGELVKWKVCAVSKDPKKFLAQVCAMVECGIEIYFGEITEETVKEILSKWTKFVEENAFVDGDYAEVFVGEMFGEKTHIDRMEDYIGFALTNEVVRRCIEFVPGVAYLIGVPEYFLSGPDYDRLYLVEFRVENGEITWRAKVADLSKLNLVKLLNSAPTTLERVYRSMELVVSISKEVF